MDGPDLAALREKAEKADGYHVLVHPDVILAVLSLVDGQQKENERLREYVAAAEAVFAGDTWDMPAAMDRVDKARAALAGSPAANDTKEGGA